ncbi:MAG: hypothetical protein V2A77_02760, partial [Pseudomonadota bacterium]
LMILALAGAAWGFSERMIIPSKGTAQDEPRMESGKQDPCLGPNVHSGCDIGNHEEVYGAYIARSDKIIIPWICRRCGYEDKMWIDLEGADPHEYDRLKKFWQEKRGQND